MRSIALLMISAILLSSCCKTSVVYKPTPVLILELPNLPLLSTKQESAIAADSYKILVEREVRLKNFIKRQKELIEINNETEN